MANPPAVAKNRTAAERKLCVTAANAVLVDGGTDEEAVSACIAAMKRSKAEGTMKRKVKRGKPLEELKGSYEYMLKMIRSAFRDQFPIDDGDPYVWIVEVFVDHVIVSSNQLLTDEFYYVPYQVEDEEYVFAARDEWEVVELAYVPQSAGTGIVEGNPPDSALLLDEFISSPRNPYGAHASFGYPGGRDAWKKAWAVHFSQVGGGSTSPAAMAPLRGTIRRIAMVAAGMKPVCTITAAEKIKPRTGPKSPLKGSFRHTPKDYGLTRWKKPSEDDVDRDKALTMTCQDLNDIKRACAAEVARRIADREKEKEKKESRQAGRKQFNEIIFEGGVVLEEAVAGKPRYINGYGITADVVNANGRVYPMSILRAAIGETQNHLHESAGQGRLGIIPIVGEAEHPSDKGQRPQFLETIVKWEEIRLDEATKRVHVRGQVIETSKGQDAITIMDCGILPGISQRAYGASKFKKVNGRRIEEVTELTITGYDLVAPGEQSDPNGFITLFENRQEVKMDPEEVLKILQESGFFDELAGNVRQQVEEAMQGRDAAQQEKALREALGIGATDDITEAVLALVKARKPTGQLETRLREHLELADVDDLEETLQARMERLATLEEAEQQRKVEAYIVEQVKAIQYPEWLRTQFQEAVLAVKPKSEKEAKEVLVEKRKEYDGIMAQIELAARGYPGLRTLGPVLERETGVPEFARGAHLLTESLVKAGKAPARKWNRPLDEMSVNERFAQMLLERFDSLYQQFLMSETRQLEEAEQTSDLSLPYSVARAVIAEAVPELVAASIFDLGVTDQSPSRIYYEAYSGESGSSASVTDESVTITALDTWYALDYKRVQPGTVVVTSDPAGTTYTEGTDYVIDYANGEIRGLTGGGISALDDVLVDYTYDAVRLGEQQAIQQAKLTLTYKTLEIAADRLATEISTEAVEFARSQIGWDATSRTLAGLVRKVRELIDKGLLYMGLSAALSVANNSGGTWSATPGGGDTYQENLDKLFRYVGVAKVKVANRYYEPTFVLASMTNSDMISNSEQFSAAGSRPDADLNAAGYVGRMKGLPVFESTQFSDSYILVGNRELVMHRVFKPMVLKGPYPSYSSNKLVASEQYYAEEFNGTDAPVTEKGSTVKLTS